MLAELIESLIISNCKLYEVCDKKKQIKDDPSRFTKKEVSGVIARDIELCKKRAELKNKINKEINKLIQSGGTEVVEEIKNY